MAHAAHAAHAVHGATPDNVPKASECVDPNGILYGGVPVSTPMTSQSRYKLARPTIEKLGRHARVQVLLVELATQNQPFMLTDPENEFHLQLRGNDILWLKENMINLGIEYLTRIRPSWAYVAWVDADVTFDNPNIGIETIQALNQFPIVQMFQTVVNKGPVGEAIKQHNGFAFQWFLKKFRHPGTKEAYGDTWHPGFCWAFTRRTWGIMSRLIDRAICGAGDHHMALGLINMAHLSYPKGVHPQYKAMVHDWQDRVYKEIRGRIGYVNGTIIHGWHGRFVDRRYGDRWQIIIETQFNPNTDIVLNDQGVYQWDTVDSRGRPDPRLPMLLINYFRVRNEDTTENTAK